MQVFISFSRRTYNDCDRRKLKTSYAPFADRNRYSLAIAERGISFTFASVCLLDSDVIRSLIYYSNFSGDRLRIVNTTMPLPSISDAGEDAGSNNVCIRTEVSSIL